MRLYQSGALLTGARNELIRRGGVLVDGPRIVAAGPLDTLMAEHPVPVDVVDLGDVTLLPGLVDAHVHLGFDGGPAPVARMRAETDAEQLILMLRSARELLSVGVTTARDLGARSFLDIAVAAATASGMAEGPRLLTAARPLTPTGGHCWFMGGECDTADDLRRMVRLHHKMGAGFVKVMSTGGFMTEGAPPWSAQFSLAEVEAVVAEAHRLGQRVAAHAHGRLGITQAVTAQVDTIEHGSFAGPDRQYGSDFDPAVVDEIAAAGIYVCPTMNAHALTLRERIGDALEKVIMGLYSGGVQIIAGTDAGIDNCPHDAYILGLEALAMVGLPAVEILDAATLRAARALGVDDRTGTIEPGKDADLIAVRGDPRTDISVLNHLELVVARGVEHRPAPYRDRRPTGPPPSGLLPDGPRPSGPLPSGLLPSGPPPGAQPAVAGPAAAASALATPAGPSPR
jgi:imidazolonepropionase-like amidohydrolase